MVALVVGSLWGSMVCRQYIAFGRTFRYTLIAAAIGVPLLLLAGGHYVTALMDRFARPSMASASDISSGRTIVWSNAFDVLASNPLYFFSGVGWNTWSFSGLRVAPHNQYLSMYFELGLVGLVAFLLLLTYVARVPLRTLKKAPVRYRAMLVSLVFSVLILLVGMLFATLGFPWVFLWTFFALSLRIILEGPGKQEAGQASGSQAAVQRAPMRTMLPAKHARKPAGA